MAEQLGEVPQGRDGHGGVWEVQEVGVAGHEMVGTEGGGESDEVIIIRISTQRLDLMIWLHVGATPHVGHELVDCTFGDESSDLRAAGHVFQLDDQLRAHGELEATLDAGLDDTLSYTGRGNEGRDEDVRVEDDAHLPGRPSASGPQLLLG